MIVGIGTDMIEVARIKKACLKERFIERIYTERERQFCKQYPEKAAGNFAVKEAVVKIFQTGFSGIEPKEIEVLRRQNGSPYINLYGKAKEKQEELRIRRWHISITNVKEYAMAFVIGEGEER